MNALVPLSVHEYAVWLREHMAQGGTITHAYDYPYERVADRMFRAVRDFRTGGECGAAAVHVLPSRGVRHLGGDLGHNVIFSLDGTSGWMVAVYADAVFDGIPGVREARDAQARSDQEFRARMRAREAEQERLAYGSDVPRRFGHLNY